MSLMRDKIALLALLASAIVWTGLSLVPVEKGLLHQFGYELLFRVRSITSSPVLDPRIKIFAYDDRTVSMQKRFDITLQEWARVFSALAERKPRAILLDKLFDNPEYSGADVESLIDNLKGLSVPVIPIGFSMDRKIPYRDQLQLTTDIFIKLKAFQSDKVDRKLFIYGPDTRLAAYFSSIGHAMYHPGGFVPLMISGQEFSLPHWSLTVAENVEFSSSGVNVNGKIIPANSRGMVLANLENLALYQSKTLSMGALISRALKGKPVSVIEEGDYVVILPAMYTGNTDWRESPLGTIQGGYVMVAMLDSVLSGRWLTAGEWSWLMTFLCSFLAAPLMSSSLRSVFVTGIVAVFSWVACAVLLFRFADTAIDCVHPAGSIATSFLIVMQRVSAQSWKQRLRMQHELKTAKIVQKSFFPKSSSEILDIETFYEPSSECSGDWWVHFASSKGHEYVLIADATGHGVSAALMTAMTFAAVESIFWDMRDHPDRVWSPGEICANLNRIFRRTTDGVTTMTCFAARIDPQDGTMLYCNAAHNFPFKISRGAKDGKSAVSKIPGGGTPIGMFDDAEFPNRKIVLQSGDQVVFFTDGIVENVKAFGPREFRSTLETQHYQSPKDLLEIARNKYRFGLGETSADDDVTLLVVRYLGAGRRKAAA